MTKKLRRKRNPALIRSRNHARARHTRRQRQTVIDFRVVEPPPFVTAETPWVVMTFSRDVGNESESQQDSSSQARVRKVEKALREAGILTWSPQMSKKISMRGRRVSRSYPLMPGYLFATGTLDGLTSDAYAIPAAQMARFIETIKRYAAQPPQSFRPNQRVVVRGGSYDIEAAFVRQIDDDLAEVRASLLGRETTWHVDVMALEGR